MSGELIITHSPIIIPDEGKRPFETATMYVDESGTAYHQSAIEVSVNGKAHVILLDGQQVEILMKLMGPFEDR